MPCSLSGAKGPYLSQENAHDSNKIHRCAQNDVLLVLLPIIARFKSLLSLYKFCGLVEGNIRLSS
jgi:hypothetical protein